MKRSLSLLGAAVAAFVAGSFFSYWLEERKADREWLTADQFRTRVHR